MKRFDSLLRGLSFAGQLGISFITPPLVLIFFAQLLMTRCGWGVWVMVCAILVGILSGASSVYSTLKKLLEKQKKKEKTDEVCFNQHF